MQPFDNDNPQKPAKGFTMIEVLIALAIVSSALVILITTNQSAIKQSIRSRLSVDLNGVCESKLDELMLLGKDAPLSGRFKSLNGWQWRLRKKKQKAKGLLGLKRWTLKVYTPQQPFQPIKTISTIAYEQEDQEKDQNPK